MPLAPLPHEHRKSTGSYYTPPALINLLLSHALPPTTAPLKILDPASGPGDFLTAAHARAPHAHLHAIDINPTALTACRAALSPLHHSSLTIHHSDALLNPPPFLTPKSFDLILGNPPYVNAIEHRLPPDYKQKLRAAFPEVKGPADLAHYFLALAIRLVRPGGRIALVLPRAILNSPAAQPLRTNLPPHLRPNLLYAPERCDFFPGAHIFTCLLILGPDKECLASTHPHPESATFQNINITSDNWWSPLSPSPGTPGEASGISDCPRAGRGGGSPFNVGCSMFDVRCSPSPSSTPHPPPSPSPTLADLFHLSASMTASEAYDTLPHLTDTPDPAPGPKFITTGLIDPRTPLWGQKPCRYLKRDYHHPRLLLSPTLPRSLAKRAAQAKRPKLLLAGLSKRIEAFLDPTGEYLGAVSTYTILHPHDDIPALENLLTHLLSPATTQHLIHHLGANGLRGQHITLKKSYLQSLPLPFLCL